MMFKFFKLEEFACKHTGKNEIKEEFVHRLDELRRACGFPLVVNSGYRAPEHPLEARKSTPGTHTRGIAVDLAIRDGVRRRKLVEEALKLGFGGIGIANSFVHVDIREDTPVLWMY
jgi:uncharacterized protein YcbK (DUF882 family)